MTEKFPAAPPTGTPMTATRPSAEARRMLALRRSGGKQALASPGPCADELDELIRVAARVPDHRRVEPWRVILLEGEARHAFGERLAEICQKTARPDAAAGDIETARALPLRAPVVAVMVSSPDPDHKTPVWEQELSVGALCQNLLLAANAAGWAGVWLTEWIAYDAEVAAELGLAANERIAGFIYLGTATAAPPERPRPDIASKVTRWSAPGKSL
ncbi:MAG: nitroreductase [Gammaproteobacteria bacterium]|nr:nitroreductase [Gammaproteobacteria bacterium]